MKLYYCKHCGNVITNIKDSGVRVSCCSEVMEELVSNSTEASLEKHIPVIEANNDLITIKVGSLMHPMTPEHKIESIIVETSQRNIIYTLEDNCEITFKLDNEELLNVYSYCNLHGLWQANNIN